MKYTIHTEGGVPAYLQLYKQVREDIVQGIYPHNTKLPSKRIIADEVGKLERTLPQGRRLEIE